MYAALPLRCQMKSTAQPFVCLHNKTRQVSLVYFVELLVSGSWTFDSSGFSFRTSDLLCAAARLEKKGASTFLFPKSYTKEQSPLDVPRLLQNRHFISVFISILHYNTVNWTPPGQERPFYEYPTIYLIPVWIPMFEIPIFVIPKFVISMFVKVHSV